MSVNMPDTKPKRDYDTRSQKLRTLVTDLLEMGIVPRSLEIDGLRLEVATYQAPQQQHPQPTHGNPGVLGNEEMAIAATAATVRSYRAAAREDLRRRIREVG